MIGTLNPNNKNVTIVGGGLSGLFAAYYLLKKNYKITLYESAKRLGGMVQTSEGIEGLVEHAAHSFRSCPALLDLCADLKINLVQANTNKKYIFRFGKLKRFPLSCAETLGICKRIVFARAQNSGTMAEWADHHVGFAARQAFIAPLMRGIYACAPQHALQELVFPGLTVPPGRSLLQHMLSRKKSNHRPMMMAPKNGMGVIAQHLADFVSSHPQATLHLEHHLKTLPDAENIILAVPALCAAGLLQGAAPKTAQALSAISYAPLITITVFTEAGAYPEGVGVLCAADANLYALGVLFNASGLAGRVHKNNTASFSFMFGGTEKPEMLAANDETLRSYVEQDFKALFGHVPNISSMHITRWAQALPVYNQNLKEALAVAKTDWCKTPGHILFTNYTGQISLRGLCESASVLGDF